MTKPLLPKRHPDQDFFSCDFGNVIPKSDIASMEHPLFSLSTKPDTVIRYYTSPNGLNTVRIAPSAFGIATIHDKDVLIYCISQLMKGINESINEAQENGAKDYIAPPRKVRFKAHDLLVTTNRQTGGEAYARLKQVFERLEGTRIQTNIKTAEREITKGFGLIDSYEIVVEDPKTKRMVELEITLSEWLYNSILGQEVLSINRDYFRLRKPIERRIYEIARKHCGNKTQWKIGLDKLHKKSGSAGSLKKFRETITYIVKHSHLPDYSVALESKNVVFGYIGQVTLQPDTNRPFLKPGTIENAKKIITPLGLDIYALEEEWIEFWRKTGEPELASPDGAFINFCKKRVSKKT